MLSSLLLLLNLACASTPLDPSEEEAVAPVFSKLAQPDLWSHKILDWQARERASADRLGSEGAAAVGDVSASAAPSRFLAPGSELRDSLRAQYQAFLKDLEARFDELGSTQPDLQRVVAREVVVWIQKQAEERYESDEGFDQWPSFQEMLNSGSDDCDGLELLVFHLLRQLGYDEQGVFRTIVYRPADGLYHMVTLWFEDGQDPWVLDPTGVMTTGMPRLSEMPGWIPIRLFTETQELGLRTPGAPIF